MGSSFSDFVDDMAECGSARANDGGAQCGVVTLCRRWCTSCGLGACGGLDVVTPAGHDTCGTCRYWDGGLESIDMAFTMARRPRLPSAQSRAPGQVRALMNGKERVGGTAAAHRKDGHFVGVAVITTCITWTDLVGGIGTPGTGTCCCRCRPAVPRTAAADLLLPVAPSSLLHQPEPAPPGPAMRLRRRAWAPSACWARRMAATVLPERERGKRRRLREGVVVALVPSPAADGECCLRRSLRVKECTLVEPVLSLSYPVASPSSAAGPRRTEPSALPWVPWGTKPAPPH
ncbi:hypothetical protein DCS_07542 [Drechmeria coniospora]|uniref:Uncharacterized protein n=1 Tax=Drechmeria coniospora TaxID=98403 RepID=A0A151GER1_DRECN|nr:hypothetical protein DCS_07542 [Drechmeria coniospora]KYK55579.1 hypothetical protein DCS_07542 [Drechmeria coniospora]